MQGTVATVAAVPFFVVAELKPARRTQGLGETSPVTDHLHTMKYAGLVETRAVWRRVEPDCQFSYSRQLTKEERAELEMSEEEP